MATAPRMGSMAMKLVGADVVPRHAHYGPLRPCKEKVGR